MENLEDITKQMNYSENIQQNISFRKKKLSVFSENLFVQKRKYTRYKRIQLQPTFSSLHISQTYITCLRSETMEKKKQQKTTSHNLIKRVGETGEFPSTIQKPHQRKHGEFKFSLGVVRWETKQKSIATCGSIIVPGKQKRFI